MVQIKHELDTVQQVKEEIEELREYVDRLEEHTHRRKLRLLEQVSTQPNTYQPNASPPFEFGFSRFYIYACLWRHMTGCVKNYQTCEIQPAYHFISFI